MTGFDSDIYWSSTQESGTCSSCYDQAWAVNASTGVVGLALTTSNYYKVRCVRRAIGGAGNIVPYFLYNGTPLYVHKIDNSDALKYEVTKTYLPDAKSEYDGMLNTNTLVGQTQNDAHAAKLCDTLSAYGVTDWYLPARNQLDAMYVNRYDLGGFDASAWYWSSTQEFGTCSGCYDQAYAIFFGTGSNVLQLSTSNYFAVRCVTNTTP